jgi:hypothetical protein
MIRPTAETYGIETYFLRSEITPPAIGDPIAACSSEHEAAFQAGTKHNIIRGVWVVVRASGAELILVANAGVEDRSLPRIKQPVSER